MNEHIILSHKTTTQARYNHEDIDQNAQFRE